MLLTGKEIIREVESGNIIIDPFDKSLVGPNSLDVRLGKEIIQLCSNGNPYPYETWDLTKPIPDYHINKFTIPDEGFVLEKGVPYLACTLEKICCKKYVPWLDGRSTVGRYFLMCHMTAGRGDVLWNGTYTMELISQANDIRIYSGLPIAQVSFFSLQGEVEGYKGRYNGQIGPMLPKPLKRV